MPFFNRAGVQLYYETHGVEGTPLFLTHGYCSTSEMWQGQIESLPKNFQLIIWHMRGHRKSDYPDDQSAYSEAHTVEDMAALLEHGGYMKLAFYHVYPERVAALLIIDTGLGFKKNTAREGWNEHANATASQFEKGGLKSLQERSQERSQVSHRNAKGLALAARGMLAQRNAVVINSLPNIKVPSLVVVGGDDTPFLTASSYMANKIPGAQKVVIPNAGHAANIDQAKLFNDSLLLFLKDFQLNKARL